VLILVLGGVRSGKTAVAERLAEDSGCPVVYVATAAPGDAEFYARVARHRERRPPAWTTVEAPLHVREVIDRHPDRTIVVDCLGMLVTNLMTGLGGDAACSPGDGTAETEGQAEILESVQDLADAAAQRSGLVVIVSNEVGQGIVPPYPLGRAFRDLLGLANQIVARRADRVLYTIAGIPLDLRALAALAPEAGGDPNHEP
jgi:adenosylcobinamide kinase/adenosylcobinamide-phosphate guanylyltransferase